MKFLFIHQNFPGQFKHLAPTLAARGHEVRALGVTGSPSPGVALTNYQLQKGNTPSIHPFAQEFETKVIRAEACAREMLKLKKSGFEPDLVVGHPGWGETLFSKEIFPQAKLLNYLEFHYGKDKGDTYFDPEFQQPNLVHDMRLRVKNANNFLALDAMDTGLCPTLWQRSVLPPNYQDKVKVIFDGIDTDLVCPNDQAVVALQTQAGQNIQLAAGQEILTFICRNLEPYRGYHSLMRALPEILKARPHAQVVIVGGNQTSYGSSAPQGQTWQEIFLSEVKEKLGTDLARVHFIGKVPYATFVKIIQITRVHLYLTYPFVLSWSCIEAMSAGALIVGSDTPPVTEFITHGHNGLLVDFFDYKQIAETVIEALARPEQYLALKTQARKTIVEQYDLKRICLPQQLALVEELAKGTG
jgi:glycosyltransferase involved in cell wall biosynthesis